MNDTSSISQESGESKSLVYLSMVNGWLPDKLQLSAFVDSQLLAMDVKWRPTTNIQLATGRGIVL